MLAKPPHNILDVNDRIVDNGAESDHQAGKHHGVHGRALEIEHRDRGDE